MSKSFYSKAALFVALFLTISPAHAALIQSLDLDAAHQAYAQQAQYDSVGYLGLIDADGGLSRGGSLVVIDEHWLLLSGHQLADYAYTSLIAGFGHSLATETGPQYSINATYFYPGYVGGAGGNRDDIALAYVEESITGISPATRYYGTDEVGAHMSLVGYGTLATPSTGLLPYDWTKRGGENVVDSIGGTRHVGTNYLVTRFSPLASPWDTLPYEYCATPGDSGGGWFLDSGDLIALSSYGWSDNAGNGGIRISDYNEWIDETMASNNPSVPEPSSLVLFVGAMSLLPFLVRARNSA